MQAHKAAKMVPDDSELYVLLLPSQQLLTQKIIAY